MKVVLLASALVLTAAALTSLAAAATKHHGKRHVTQPICADRPAQFSWDFLWSTGNKPRANGCAPPVYLGNRYLGQDPDANIRLQLMRDPAEGDLSFYK